MERWVGRVAVVTGASSGIGAAISKGLVRYGMIVVGMARRVEMVQEIAESLFGEKGKLYPLEVDVSKIEDVVSTFKKVRDKFGGIDVLVNNAGFIHHLPIAGDCNLEVVRSLFETNVVGYIACANETVKNMKDNSIEDGHIFFINSTSGHEVYPTVGLFPYSASKHAVKVIAQGFRRELVKEKKITRVTSISPGMVRTEILHNSGFPGIAFSNIFPMLTAEHIADILFYALSSPMEVQIDEIIVRVTGDNM